MKALIQTSLTLKEGVTDKIILWVRGCPSQTALVLLPLALLLFALQLSSMQPTVFSKHLPLLSLLGLFFTLTFRTSGLAVVYVLLFGLLYYYSPHLWQMMLILSLAINFFVLLLAIESLEEGKYEVVALKKEQEEERGKYQAYIDSLRELVQELTQELEQRRIDKVVDEGWEAEKRAHGQLRRQFEEKSLILSATREKLFAAETALLAKEREERETRDLSFIAKEYEKQCVAMSHEQAMLETEIALLEEILSLKYTS